MKYRNDIVIKRFSDTAFTTEDVHRLVDEAWQKWFKAGLDSTVFHLSAERFAQVIKSRTVFVAIDSDTGELFGCHFLRPNRRRHCLFGSFLAVAPKAQGLGIATRLLEHEAALAVEHGYTHMQGSTATTAEWSIRWHLKNGYRIIGYQRRPQDNHPLYVFRKQLVPSLLWESALFCRCCYYASYAIAKLTKDSNGRPNLVGRVLKKMIGKSK